MKAGWVQLPIEQAPPWLRLGAVARSLGAELFRVWQERTIEGVSLADFEDVAVRMLAPDPRERKAIRAALKTIVDAGLVVASEGGVRLLYGRASYADHRRMVDASSTHGARKVDVRSTHGAQMVPAKPAEPLDQPSYIEREKERKRERESAGGRELPELPKPIPDNPEVPLPERPYSLSADFARRATAATNVPYLPGGSDFRVWDELRAALAKTAEHRGEDLRALGERVLEAFFADAWVQSQGFPVRVLRAQWSRFVEPPVPAERAAEIAQQRERQRIQEARNRSREDAAKRLGTIPVKLLGGDP